MSRGATPSESQYDQTEKDRLDRSVLAVSAHLLARDREKLWSEGSGSKFEREQVTHRLRLRRGYASAGKRKGIVVEAATGHWFLLE